MSAFFLRAWRRRVCARRRAATGLCGNGWEWPSRLLKPTVKRASIALWRTWGPSASGPCSSPWTAHRKIRRHRRSLEPRSRSEGRSDLGPEPGERCDDWWIVASEASCICRARFSRVSVCVQPQISGGLRSEYQKCNGLHLTKTLSTVGQDIGKSLKGFQETA